MGNAPSAPAPPPFTPTDLQIGVAGMFGFLHALTGLLALLFEKDMLYGTLLEIDSFKVPGACCEFDPPQRAVLLYGGSRSR